MVIVFHSLWLHQCTKHRQKNFPGVLTKEYPFKCRHGISTLSHYHLVGLNPLPASPLLCCPRDLRRPWFKANQTGSHVFQGEARLYTNLSPLCLMYMGCGSSIRMPTHSSIIDRLNVPFPKTWWIPDATCRWYVAKPQLHKWHIPFDVCGSKTVIVVDVELGVGGMFFLQPARLCGSHGSYVPMTSPIGYFKNQGRGNTRSIRCWIERGRGRERGREGGRERREDGSEKESTQLPQNSIDNPQNHYTM